VNERLRFRALQRLAELLTTLGQWDVAPPGFALPPRAHHAYGYLAALRDLEVLDVATLAEWGRRFSEVAGQTEAQRRLRPGASGRLRHEASLSLTSEESSGSPMDYPLDADLLAAIPVRRNSRGEAHGVISVELWSHGITVRWFARLSGDVRRPRFDDHIPELRLEDDAEKVYTSVGQRRSGVWADCLRLETDFIPRPEPSVRQLAVTVGRDVVLVKLDDIPRSTDVRGAPAS